MTDKNETKEARYIDMTPTWAFVYNVVKCGRGDVSLLRGAVDVAELVLTASKAGEKFVVFSFDGGKTDFIKASELSHEASEQIEKFSRYQKVVKKSE